MIRMILVEDQQILLDSLYDSLSMTPNLDIVAKTTDAGEILSLCEFYKPDLVLMDICNAEGHMGISETVRLKEKMPEIKVILMTAMPDMSFVHDAKQAGADSFVYKNVSKDDLIKSIESTMQNYNTFPAEQQAPAAGLDLTEREEEILRLVCQGQSRKEISESLFLSENTVRNNINKILAKTGFDSIAQLAIFAVSKGFIVPDQTVNDLN
ncbi:MAG: response regulator transcription factor [Eubacteriales bacterium]|nr:response regulator transcription factor [Clostridiales bacterium]MDY5836968.1 response regulator transcription factor [Eubacteriales bacterium]